MNVVYLNSGPCLLLYIAKENCVDDFCKFLGTFSREEFSEMPGTYDYLFTHFKFAEFFIQIDFDMILMM